MKKYLSILLITLFGVAFSNAQTPTCEESTLLCLTNGSFTYPSIVNQTVTNSNIDYDCLAAQPNKSWFTIQIGTPGIINFSISQVNAALNPIDVDFIIWGPFSSPSCGPNFLNQATEIDCSFSAAATENFSINNSVANQYYTLMVTNYSGQPGFTTITQTNFNAPNAGNTNCTVNCPLTLGPDLTVCQNDPIILIASIGDGNYQWFSSSEGLLPYTTQSIVVSPSNTTTYTVIVNKPGCATNITDSVTLNTLNLVYQQPNDLVQCSATGTATFDLTTVRPEILPNVNLTEYEFYFTTTESDAHQLTNIISDPNLYSTTNSQTLYFTIIDNSINGGSCLYVGSFDVIVLPEENPIVSASSFGQTITVNATGNGNYQYQLDNGSLQSSPVFENVTLGMHTVNVISSNGCGSGSTSIQISIPNEPDAISPQYFNNGDTVSNLIANGQNIQWYATETGRNIYQTNSTPLPTDTQLVDGFTYYASQTVNGLESVNRTPVLALLNPLSFDNFVFSQLSFVPNPVKNNLTIANNLLIDSVEVISILGQKMLSQKVNSLQTDIDMSAFSKGIYFVKVTSDGQDKTIKIVKE